MVFLFVEDSPYEKERGAGYGQEFEIEHSVQRGHHHSIDAITLNACATVNNVYCGCCDSEDGLTGFQLLICQIGALEGRGDMGRMAIAQINDRD